MQASFNLFKRETLTLNVSLLWKHRTATCPRRRSHKVVRSSSHDGLHAQHDKCPAQLLEPSTIFRSAARPEQTVADPTPDAFLQEEAITDAFNAWLLQISCSSKLTAQHSTGSEQSVLEKLD